MKRETPDAARIIGARIRGLRKERGMTQEVLAERSSLTPEAIARVERATRKPTVETLGKLAHGLAVSIGDLLVGETKAPTTTLSRHLRQIVSQLEHQDAVVQKYAASMIDAYTKAIRATKKKKHR